MRSLLLDLPEEILIRTIYFIDVPDILVLKLSCHFLHTFLKQRIIWVNAFLYIRRAVQLHIASFPVDEMTVDQLELVCTSYLRFLRVLRHGSTAVDTSPESPFLVPVLPSSVIPSFDATIRLENPIRAISIALGGRYLAVLTDSTYELWDIGYDPRLPMSTKPVASVPYELEQGCLWPATALVTSGHKLLGRIQGLTTDGDGTFQAVYEIDPNASNPQWKLLGKLRTTEFGLLSCCIEHTILTMAFQSQLGEVYLWVIPTNSLVKVDLHVKGKLDFVTTLMGKWLIIGWEDPAKMAIYRLPPHIPNPESYTPDPYIELTLECVFETSLYEGVPPEWNFLKTSAWSGPWNDYLTYDQSARIDLFFYSDDDSLNRSTLVVHSTLRFDDDPDDPEYPHIELRRLHQAVYPVPEAFHTRTLISTLTFPNDVRVFHWSADTGGDDDDEDSVEVQAERIDFHMSYTTPTISKIEQADNPEASILVHEFGEARMGTILEAQSDRGSSNFGEWSVVDWASCQMSPEVGRIVLTTPDDMGIRVLDYRPFPGASEPLATAGVDKGKLLDDGDMISDTFKEMAVSNA
ncbi:hypothetical protein DL96DRAFT_1620058 [Flagelloscypha sp. PMI_526]|nr:hypothetical protein DL96DRAFT_1620058 [Flagelloscypha sp. PMI_526]